MSILIIVVASFTTSIFDFSGVIVSIFVFCGTFSILLLFSIGNNSILSSVLSSIIGDK